MLGMSTSLACVDQISRAVLELHAMLILSAVLHEDFESFASSTEARAMLSGKCRSATPHRKKVVQGPERMLVMCD